MSEDKTNADVATQGEQEEDTTNGSGATIETVTVQKRKALEQRDEARAELEALKSEKEAAKVVEPTATPTPSNDDSDWKQKIEFTIANQHLGEEVIQEVLSQAKAKGITTVEALELPVVKSFIETTKSEQAVINAAPVGGRSPRTQPAKPIHEMDEDEHKAHFDKVVGK